MMASDIGLLIPVLQIYTFTKSKQFLTAHFNIWTAYFESWTAQVGWTARLEYALLGGLKAKP